MMTWTFTAQAIAQDSNLAYSIAFSRKKKE